MASGVFALLLCGLLAVPIVGAALEAPAELPAFRPRPPAAVSILALDRLPGLPEGRFPRSREPVAGIAFVRCTGLWLADPDGSHERRLLPVDGISSPAFAPDGRTIAFVRNDVHGQTLWLAAADGSDVVSLGRVEASGGPVPARVTGLAWAPVGGRIAFALTDATHGPFSGGSAIWTVEPATGKFGRVGSGWPAPAWYGKRIVSADHGLAPDVQLDVIDGAGRVERELNSSEDDLAAAVVPQGWWNNSRNGIAVLRSSRGQLHLAMRNLWGTRDRTVVEPPAGYRFPRYAQPSITQDASRVAIDLLDPGAGRDLGLLDPVTGKWTILDYAWEPSASATPTIVGPLERRDASNVAEMLLSNWSRRSARAEMLTAGDSPPSLFPWRFFGWMTLDPERIEDGWRVPVMTHSYGMRDEPYAYRQADIIVRRDRGRLTATPSDVGPLTTVNTIAEAHDFAEAVVGRDLPELPELPEGSRLADEYALSASNWTGSKTTTINTVAPPPDGSGPQRRMSFSYGDDIDFSLGCGGAVDPDPAEVAGGPAMIDHVSGTRQVIWPATPEDPTGPFSIHGNLSREELLALAEAAASQ